MAKKTVITFFAFIVGLSLFAVIMTLLLSFFSYYKYPQLLPSKFTPNYWINMFMTNSLFKTALLSSLTLGILSGIFSTVIGFMTGKGIVENNWHKKQQVMLLYTLPLFIPATALFIGTHLVMIQLGLNNTVLGVLFAHSLVSIPYTTNIAISFYEGFSLDYVNAAKTLGTKSLDVLRYIYIPIMLPSLSLSFGMSFLLSISEYFSTFLIGGGQVITLSTLYYPFIGNGDYGNSAVLSVIFVGINILVFGCTGYFVNRFTTVTKSMFD